MSDTVLVIGSFDVLHYGHLSFLRQAAHLGRVVVALGTDDWQRSYKRDPILPYQVRRAALLELPWVDEVVRRNEKSCKQLCAQFDPRWLPYGSDWTLEDYLAINGLDQTYIDYYEIIPVRFINEKIVSTTKIIERVLESEGHSIQNKR